MPLPAPPTVFQTYLHSALPFRRKSSSATTASSSFSSSSWRRRSAAADFSPPLSPGSEVAVSTPGTSPDLSTSASSGFVFRWPAVSGRRESQHRSRAYSKHDSVIEDEDERPEPFLNGSSSHLRCASCLADLCLTSQIISKGFTGRHGRAYLVSPTQFTGISCPAPASPSSPRAPNRTRKRNPFARTPPTLEDNVGSVSRGGSGGSWTSTLFTSPLSFSGGATSSSATPPQMPDKNVVANLPNTHVHRPVPRTLVTGYHTVSDVSCAKCGVTLGWKYVDAEDESQRYKVGKFILETRRVVRWVGWEEEECEPVSSVFDRDDEADARSSEVQGDSSDGDSVCSTSSSEDGHDDGAPGPSNGADRRGANGVRGQESLDDDDIEFDSQDEDECDDLFAGVWSPQLARKRREKKAKAWEPKA